MKKLVKFSQPACTPCASLKVYLESKGVKYEEVDVFENTQLAVKYGIMGGLPVVLLLDGEEVIDRTSGFNPSFTEPIDNLISQL